MKEFRKLPHQVQVSFDFSHSVEQIWPWIADTDRMNKAAGLPPVQYRNEPDPDGGSRRYGRFRVHGIELAWLEHPYEWELHKYFHVERSYSKGPAREVDAHFEFTPISEGTRLTLSFSFKASNPVLAFVNWIQLRFGVSRSYLRVFRELNQKLILRAERARETGVRPFAPYRRNPVLRPGPGATREILAKLKQSGVEKPQARFLLDFIFRSDDQDLLRIRPFHVAKEHGQDRIETVRSFLRAARAGIFDISWDLICPNCRGAKQRVSRLQNLTQEAHCDSCNIVYGADFELSVEVSFTVNPSVRKVSAAEYCVGGPLNTPHYLAQLRMSPGESQRISLELSPGAYVVRSPHSKRRQLIEVAAGVQMERPSVKVDLDAESATFPRISVPPGELELVLGNHMQREALVIVERSELYDEACTAALVTTLQDFRDIFSGEALKKGQEIKIASLALLFTDLKGSTALYRRVGDALAFSLVQDHFEVLIDCVRRNQGALIKTIGDAVMAAFCRPEDAVQAAIEIHRGIDALNKASSGREQLRVKIGIHHGPCFAVNLNERLDYFGSTVNIAARTEGQCEGGDIVITKTLQDDPNVRAVIEKSRLSSTPLVKTLKGLEENFELLRIQCLP